MEYNQASCRKGGEHPGDHLEDLSEPAENPLIERFLLLAGPPLEDLHQPSQLVPHLTSIFADTLRPVLNFVDEINKLDVTGAEAAAESSTADWEEVEAEDQEVAIRVDQYLVVFLKVSTPIYGASIVISSRSYPEC